MRRRLLPIASLVSLALFVATLILWVRSYSRNEHILLGHERPIFYAALAFDGEILLARGPHEVMREMAGPDEVASLVPGISYSRRHPQPDVRLVWVRFWYPTAAAFILMAIFGICWFRRRRVLPGCCRVCGYDLRATPTRCPECGTDPRDAC